ncbi:MAG TPA: hypothetical protein VEG08_13130 [Terriglobales bacterium]|nr:hypothetical protein [Terriglobales bacterium]
MKSATAAKLLAMVTLGTTMLYAQATRTWVSGVGDDANPCSRTAPCKTWAGAISKTAAGGEIDALDPAGFGAVTITKAITLDGGGGQVASVLVSGTNGIVVQAGANDVVTLRHLRFNGIGTGLNAIRFLAGKELTVENCFIFGFTQNGIDIALNQATQARVHVINTVINNNAGVGIRAANAQVPAVQVGVEGSNITLDNIGIEAAQHSRVLVNHSITELATNDGMKADDAATGDAQMAIESSESTFNANGITAGAGSSVNVGGSRIINNSSCSLNNSGGTLFSFTQGGAGTNRISGGTCGTITPLAQ